MASLRQRNGRWQARVIRTGYADEVRTFHSRAEAERWARSVEAAIDNGSFVGLGPAESMTLGTVIERYMVEVLPYLKGEEADRIRLRAMLRNPLTLIRMSQLTPQRVARYRDERLQHVAAGTVMRELAYLSAIINHARREWSIAISNPVTLVRRPAAPKGRDRVVTEAEQTKLLAALEPTGRRNPLMKPLVVFALETGMRRGELLALYWEKVSLERRIAVLETTKNGDSRVVPLSTRAVHTLIEMGPADAGAVFPLKPAAVSKAFELATVRAGLHNLRFHDLRHTAITRIATKVPNLIELAAISGHKSLAMLKRYYHPRAEDLAAKLG